MMSLAGIFWAILYFCKKKYKQAIKEFKEAIRLKEDNSYAFCKLSRCYALLYLNESISGIKILNSRNKQLSIEMYQKAQLSFTPDARRITWLKSWLKKCKLL